MLEKLKEIVYEANMELKRKGLIIYTWGNVSEIDRQSGLVVIKPSGIAYNDMTFEDMVVVDLEGNMVEGNYKPSTDLLTHLMLYKQYQDIGGIVHTHSDWATTFAQAGMSIPAFGTTHADYFFGNIPCTRDLTDDEINGEYEKETGKVIIETIAANNPMDIPAVIVKKHGPFTWGKDADSAVCNAVVLEKVAELAYKTLTLNLCSEGVNQNLLDKHYQRKHGAKAYYGQK